MPARLGRETIICCERLMKYVQRLDETVTVLHLRLSVKCRARFGVPVCPDTKLGPSASRKRLARLG